MMISYASLFIIWVVDEWNRLGSQTVSVDSVKTIKRRLGKFLEENEIIY